MAIDKSIMDDSNLAKLTALGNPKVVEIVEGYIGLCKPAKATVVSDSKEDIAYIRDLALKNSEEKALALEGHSIHFDGYYDLARDKGSTKILLPEGVQISKKINTMERKAGLAEIHGLLDNSMEGKEMIIAFFCLGPVKSEFSIPALQLTDSAYVAHSESLLYRQGYEEFRRKGNFRDFFYFIHSAGRLENGISADYANRRIYIDLEDYKVLSVNNQYAGNSIGLKKLALRLAIRQSNTEDWLTEHMFIMGIHPDGKERVTYFTGAYPSACGKTSTAMVPGQSIVGDDIAYLRIDGRGIARAVNIEQGIFGIIEDVNPIDDPLIFKALTTPRELIFSNVLINENAPYWLGMGKPLPKSGVNYFGNWEEGLKDKDGNAVLAAHKNARYTIRIGELDNADPLVNDPFGVPISGFIYGSRDSDTSPPVVQSLGWAHGVFIGACLESETTAATIGKIGERQHNPMANFDFLTVPLGLYIRNHLRFGECLDNQPLVFSTNYFLKKDGKFLNEKVDKKVWLMWMEGRVHEEFRAIETPIGFIPLYGDLEALFMQVFGKGYPRESYIEQFSIRASKLLDKLDRIEEIYTEEEDIPEVFKNHLEHQRARLKDAVSKFGKDVISPFDFKG